MARGVLSGVIWGAVVAGAGAGGLSLAYPDFKPGSVPMAEPEQQAMAKPDEDVAPMQEAMPKPGVPDVEDVKDAPGETPDAAAEPANDVDPAQDAAEEEVVTAASLDTSEERAEEQTPAPEENPEPVQEEPAPEADVAEQSEPSAPELADTTPEPEAEPEPEAQPMAEAEISPEADPTEAPEEDAQAETEEDPAPSITEEIVAALPKPDGTVGNLAPNVTTGRLPSVTNDEDVQEDAPTAVAPPPLERFAAEYQVDGDKPLMSIVLIDDGTTELGFDALESFPYPLTFAVDASAPTASERMANYRARGLEVMALVSMPQGATASDAEVAMAAYLAAVPEAVAILEDPDASLQTNRGLSDQIIQILQSTGHGVVFQASGLNTAQKLAVKEGVASARVFRDFDGSNQSATVIRRFMDQAAFKAGQEGAVVMLGRLRAETISALLIWGLADRASRVALVPVSTILKGALDAPE